MFSCMDRLAMRIVSPASEVAERFDASLRLGILPSPLLEGAQRK